jgi:predicted HD phosphohydrolase
MGQEDELARGLSPLGEPHWARARAGEMSVFSRDDWIALDRQRDSLLAREKPRVALELFASLGAEPSFGYEINMQRHGLQAATFALRDGRDEETVVVALLHDIGFTLARETHGAIAAMVLGPHISEANRWMLVHHAVFLDHHAPTHPAADADARERWRGHEHFEWTATFVERYDQAAVSAQGEILPLDAFRPMVYRVLARRHDRVIAESDAR